MDFIVDMFGSNKVEIIATVLGLINITLIIRRSIWNFPFGMVMVILYGFVFFDAKLYLNSSLQIYFLIMQAIGWWWWLKKTDDRGLVIVERLPAKQRLAWVIIGTVAIILLGTIISRYTDGVLPYNDAAIAALSMIAQFFLAKRYLENWLVWICVDIIAVWTYLDQGLYPTAALYSAFLCIATFGYFRWRTSWKSGEAVEA